MYRSLKLFSSFDVMSKLFVNENKECPGDLTGISAEKALLVLVNQYSVVYRSGSAGVKPDEHCACIHGTSTARVHR